MNIYVRTIRYSPNIVSKLIQFFTFSVIEVCFQVMNFALVIPLLGVLFKPEAYEVIPELPEWTLSMEAVKGTFMHYFVSIIIDYGALSALFFVCLVLIVGMIMSNTFRYIERMIASRIKVDVVKNLRMDIFRSVSKLHIGYFNDQRKGDLISRFTNDLIEIENAVVNGLKFVWKEPIAIIVFFIALFTISVKLTLFTLIILPLTGGVVGEIVKRLKKQAFQSQESVGRIVNILDETFSGMRVVKAFNARNFIIKKLEDESTLHRKINLSIARKNELASPVSEVLGVIIMASIMYFGGSLVLGGEFSLKPEVFIGFLILFAQVIQPAKNFSQGITSLQKGVVSAKRIYSIMDIEPAIKNKPDAIKIKSFEDRIEYSNVSFAYDREYVLRNINLTVEKGKTIALVGPSGGGKSTLADLVPRFYDPTEGDVKLDGQSLKDYDVESLRQLIGVVTQESILFNDTIFNNISFGMENVKEEDVINAAKIANAHNFIIETENGYNTVIGERGSKLSGGQRQRLSIARAVLKNPPILILDEATSALDSESERLVQEALTNLMKNRTSLVIAHRLSTIQHADEIIVIQNGMIHQRGTHDELILEEGLYRKLNEIQKV